MALSQPSPNPLYRKVFLHNTFFHEQYIFLYQNIACHHSFSFFYSCYYPIIWQCHIFYHFPLNKHLCYVQALNAAINNLVHVLQRSETCLYNKYQGVKIAEPLGACLWNFDRNCQITRPQGFSKLHFPKEHARRACFPSLVKESALLNFGFLPF